MSKPRGAALSLADTLSLLVPNPLPLEGPRGWRTTLIAGESISRIVPLREPEIDAGSVGTGGMDDSPLPVWAAYVPLPNSAPKPPGERRDGDAIVAYPSRIFPLEARDVRRGAVVCSVFMSGIDFLVRSELAVIWADGVMYAEGARDSCGCRCVLACEYRCGFIQSIRVECERES